MAMAGGGATSTPLKTSPLLHSRAECDLVVAGRGAPVHMVGVVGGVRISVGAGRGKFLGAGSWNSSCAVVVVATVSRGTRERVG